MADAKLFVGGLSWETSDENLRHYFSKYGDVLDAIVMRDSVSGRSRGFGFVTFTDPSACDKVLETRHVLDGKSVDPKRAVPRDQIQNAPPARTLGGPSMGMGMGYSQPTGTEYGQSSGSELRTRKIFVGGIAQTTTEDVLRHHFSQYGNVEEIMIMMDKETRRPRGFAFVTFDTEDAVEHVLERKMHEIDNKHVEVKKAEPKGYRSNPSVAVQPMRMAPDYRDSSFAVPYGSEAALLSEYDRSSYANSVLYRPQPEASPFNMPYDDEDELYEASLYTAAPGSLGVYSSSAGVGAARGSGLAVPYMANTSYAASYSASTSAYAQYHTSQDVSTLPTRSPAPYGAIGASVSGAYQDPYYGAPDLGVGYEGQVANAGSMAQIDYGQAVPRPSRLGNSMSVPYAPSSSTSSVSQQINSGGPVPGTQSARRPK